MEVFGHLGVTPSYFAKECCFECVCKAANPSLNALQIYILTITNRLLSNGGISI